MPDLSTLAFLVVFVAVVGYGLNRGLKPLDRLRRRTTTGLEVHGPEQPVRRGEEVEARISITSARELGAPEVGLVCTEYYDEEDSDSKGHTTRITNDAVAHEAWARVEPLAGMQSVRLPIPADAPFSYEGSALSFRWELVARGRRKGLDAQARTKLTVYP